MVQGRNTSDTWAVLVRSKLVVSGLSLCSLQANGVSDLPTMVASKKAATTFVSNKALVKARKHWRKQAKRKTKCGTVCMPSGYSNSNTTTEDCDFSLRSVHRSFLRHLLVRLCRRGQGNKESVRVRST